MAKHEVPLPELDLWGVTPVQRSVLSDMCMEQRPIAALDWNKVIQFQFTLGEDEYMLFSETYLYLRVLPKFKKADKTEVFAVTDQTTFIPANYLLHSMIESVQLTIGSTSVSYEVQAYCYKAYIEALLGYSSEAKKSHLSSSLWIENKEERSMKLFKNQAVKPIELKGKLHIDFTHQNRAIIGGSRITLNIKLNKENFFMQAPAKCAHNFELLDAVLHVHRMQVAPKIVTAHNKALAHSNAKYPMTRTAIQSQIVVKGSKFVHLDKLLVGQSPRRIFFTLVGADAWTGSASVEPYRFNHYNLGYIVCFKDGQMIPRNGYTMNFEEGIFIDAYTGFIQTLNQNGTDSYAAIDMTSWETNKCIFGFNLVPDLSNGSGLGSHISETTHASIRFDLRFTKAVEKDLVAIIFAEYDTVVEITSDRQLLNDLIL